MILKSLRTGAAIATLATFASLSTAQAADEFFLANPEKNIAISGYDAVAYHTVGAPTKGSADYKYEHAGVTWKFASAENMEKFKADPAKFAPAYGGWCAVGTGKAKKIPTQPHLFKIVDGQLYLNSSDGAQNLFVQETTNRITLAEGNWPEIESKAAGDL
ncbi:MAG: YHS domain-containing (seleno)protein [Pseudomonadota bacterium]